MLKVKSYTKIVENKKRLIISIFLLVMPYIAYTQELKNYFSLQKITIENAVFNLAWSSHPNDIYFKHEYLPNNEKLESYKSMILIDVIKTDIPINTAIGSKVAELEERKKTHKICNYQVLQNAQTGEYMIDFLVSSGIANKPNIVEWNFYRYKKTTTTKGEPIILLFALSKRAYGEEIRSFIIGLKESRINWRNSFTKYFIPAINI